MRYAPLALAIALLPGTVVAQTEIFRDTFTHVSTVELATAVSSRAPDTEGTSWVEEANTSDVRIDVIGSQEIAEATLNGGQSHIIYTGRPNPIISEYDIDLTFRGVDAAGDDPFFLIARMSAPTTYYAVQIYPTSIGVINLFLVQNGSWTMLEQSTTAIATNDVVTFEVRDTSKAVYVNGGDDILCHTDNTLTAAGAYGVAWGNIREGFSTEDVSPEWEMNVFDVEEDTTASTASCSATGGGTSGSGLLALTRSIVEPAAPPEPDPVNIVTGATLNPCVEDSPCERIIVAQDGVTPYSWAEVGSALNTGDCVGLTASTVAGDWVVSGTPTVAGGGTCVFTGEVTDSTSPTPGTDSRQFTLVIDASGAATGDDYYEGLKTTYAANVYCDFDMDADDIAAYTIVTRPSDPQPFYDAGFGAIAMPLDATNPNTPGAAAYRMHFPINNNTGGTECPQSPPDIVDGDTILVTWDTRISDGFAGDENVTGLFNNFKAFAIHTDVAGDGTISASRWHEIKYSMAGGPAIGVACEPNSTFSMNFTTDAFYARPKAYNQGANGFLGPGVQSEPLGKDQQLDCYFWQEEEWIRQWHYYEKVAGSCNAETGAGCDLYSMWVAAENQPPIQIHDQLQWEVPQQFKWFRMQLENTQFDTAQPAELTIWTRNMLWLINTDDPATEAILDQPIP